NPNWESLGGLVLADLDRSLGFGTQPCRSYARASPALGHKRAERSRKGWNTNREKPSVASLFGSLFRDGAVGRARDNWAVAEALRAWIERYGVPLAQERSREMWGWA